MKSHSLEAVFLDRDGVVIRDRPDYVTAIEQVSILSNSAKAIRLLNDLRIPVVLVSNQGAVGKGIISEADLWRIHEYMQHLLQQEAGASLDAAYYCPYHPEGDLRYAGYSEWRKPKPGMLKQAAQDLGVELTNSTMIGDAEADIRAAAAARCRSMLVLTGLKSAQHEQWVGATPDVICTDVLAAAEWLQRNAI